MLAEEEEYVRRILADAHNPTHRLELASYLEEAATLGGYDCGDADPGDANRIAGLRIDEGHYIVDSCSIGRIAYAGKKCLWWLTGIERLTLIGPIPDGCLPRCRVCERPINSGGVVLSGQYPPGGIECESCAERPQDKRRARLNKTEKG